MFLAWLLYKLVFDFIIPAYKVTRSVRKQMSDIQQHMREQYEEQQSAQGQGSQQAPPVSRPASKPSKDDYIDFEEIK
ncbi:hypothetical protein [Chitinophaga flava]|uniref:DUF4834 domain-containing protein n=1 Tax=Chitinophaga flava TaxID=2259036 RepID=A0A365Y4H8_9BACT|nr:hypothetical protein [Chitinophaga flava]RBL93399.1 hypothetical protein DF182_12855 [Chitinophaga flava]